MVHSFEFDGVYMAVDTFSGAVHVLDRAAFMMLSYGPDFNIDEIAASVSDEFSVSEIESAVMELNNLIDNGMLFTDQTGEIPSIMGQPVVKALCLNIAHDCNLRCRYCFASTGDFDGDRLLMKAETGKKALDFLVKNSGHRINLEVDFFGGEPLMNLDAVKEVVEYGRRLETLHNKKFKFTITTNGIGLNDDIIKYINSEFSNVVISIDGRQEIHDNMRPSINGKGSYDLIIDGAKKLAESRNDENYYVRGTFTAHNLDFYKDVIDLNDLGFGQISIEPVVCHEDSDWAITDVHLDEIMESYDNLTREMAVRIRNNSDFNFFHFMVDLEQGPCAAKRVAGCGAGSEYVAVVPGGDIYPCHQFVGDEKFIMGNVNDDTINDDIQQEFRGSNLTTRDECMKCWARFYCGGGCAANGYYSEGSINKAYKLGCKMERKRLECALYLKAVKSLECTN